MLSPNHGLADKRNGPWAVSKVVRKFPYGNFLPSQSQKSCALSLRGFSAALRRSHAPAF